VQDHKIKFWSLQSQVLVLIHQVPKTYKIILVLKRNYEDFWRQRRWSNKGQQKVKTLIGSFIDPWRHWWNQILKKASLEGHVSSQHSKEAHHFCLILKKRRFQILIVLFVFLWTHANTNKELQWQIECNESFSMKQMTPLVLFKDIIH